MYYLATLFPAKEGGFTVMYKDFPEALSEGKSFEEATANAREVLALTMEEYVREGREIPAPTETPDMLWARRQLPGNRAEPVFVAVEAPEGGDTTPVRTSISFTKAILVKIDQHAEMLGMTRSGYLSTAGLAYAREPGKSPAEELDAEGKKYGLARKHGEKYMDFAGRIFAEQKKERASSSLG